MKRPSFQFYPGDWQRDAALRMCSLGARGLWIDMLCIMHQGSPYGHLKVNGKAITLEQLTRMVGGDVQEISSYLQELESAAVFSREDDGAIFSRRMTKDEELRSIRADGGKLGGNPKLMGGYHVPGFVYLASRSDGKYKIGCSTHPAKRMYKIRQQFEDMEILLLAQMYVPDMGQAEAETHQKYGHCREGEWFALSTQEAQGLIHLMVNGKGEAKANSTPSSSSSSSSSIEKSKALPASRKAKLPDDFYPDPTGIRKAHDAKIIIAAELERFTDFHKAKGSTMLDWQAAWRTWVSNAVKFARQPTVSEAKAEKDRIWREKMFGKKEERVANGQND